MYNIYTLNKVSTKGTDLFDSQYTLIDSVDNADAIIVRSAKMHEMDLPQSVLAVARAGAGVNNIPVESYAEKGIAVFNTPGANANAVKEMVIAAMLLSSRDIINGVNWAQGLKAEVAKEVEKGKGAFVGPEILGKKLGVVGLGAIGVMVANAANALGMEVIGYDPYISIHSAWGLSRDIKRALVLDEIFEECDYISLHVPALEATKHMINQETLSKVKQGVRILNFARDILVDNQAIIAALDEGKVSKYVTDFPVEELLGNDKIITIPHLGASTPESEENCAVMAVKQLRDYIENGNISNSVNFPNCDMVWSSSSRLTIMHENIPAMIGKITAIIAEEGINITNMINKSKGEWAYTIIDTDTSITIQNISKIEAIASIKRVRVLKK